MTGHEARVATLTFPALGTSATLLTADHRTLRDAHAVLVHELAAIDETCSRFRPDSELSRINAAAGTRVMVSELFAQALTTALRAAEITDGAVDPTVGRAVIDAGYDRTFAAVRPESATPLPVAKPAAGWHRVSWDPHNRLLQLPAGTALDFGATAKALAADRAAERAAWATGGGVLVNLGGDVATAGTAPNGGWTVAVGDDHARPGPGPVVTVTSGALATSGTSVRTWQRASQTVHHIVDPATGRSTPPHWRTATVAAASCVDANTASTAAIVLGPSAVEWLTGTGLPARLVHIDGTVVELGGWPAAASPAGGDR